MKTSDLTSAALDWARITADEDYTGPNALIAAMRCYVASKLGDEIDIPEVLIETATRGA